MREEEIGRAFQTIVADEPPLFFDPDLLTRRAAESSKRRRMALVSGGGVAAVAVTAVTMFSGPRMGDVAAPPTSCVPSASKSCSTPNPMDPDYDWAAEEAKAPVGDLATRAKQIRDYLSKNASNLVQDFALTNDVSGPVNTESGKFDPKGPARLVYKVKVAEPGLGDMVITVDGRKEGKPTLTSICTGEGVQCQGAWGSPGNPRQELVTQAGRDGVWSLTHYFFRADGSVVSAAVSGTQAAVTKTRDEGFPGYRFGFIVTSPQLKPVAG